MNALVEILEILGVSKNVLYSKDTEYNEPIGYRSSEDILSELGDTVYSYIDRIYLAYIKTRHGSVILSPSKERTKEIYKTFCTLLDFDYNLTSDTSMYGFIELRTGKDDVSYYDMNLSCRVGGWTYYNSLKNIKLLKVIRFYREDKLWYADIPKHTKEDNLIVPGSDILLNTVYEFGDYADDEIVLAVDDSNTLSDIILWRKSHNQFGASYCVFGKYARELDMSGSTCWLCNVVHDVFQDHSRFIAIRLIV